METLFEYRLYVVVFELGLEVPEGLGGRVGAATGVDEVVSVVLCFVSVSSPAKMVSVYDSSSQCTGSTLPVALAAT